MKLYFTPEAKRDLVSIGDWIAKENLRRAESFVDELKMSCAEIMNFPEKYALTSQFENQALRRKVHGSYLIFYRIRSDWIEIIHVLHCAVDLKDLS